MQVIYNQIDIPQSMVCCGGSISLYAVSTFSIAIEYIQLIRDESSIHILGDILLLSRIAIQPLYIE
jgi:hypothetical protein